MIDWTEQEEQEMIARAKAGDPKANYELSLWALERSEEEPDEIRWNRLAAKCLVKAAQAGYSPAQDRMAGLLEQRAAQAQTTARRAEPEPEDEEIADEPPAPVRISDARRSRRPAPAPVKQKPRQTTTARRPIPQEDDFEEDEPEEDEDYEDYDEDDLIADEDRPGGRRKPRGAGRKKPLPFSSWGESQWRKMELICIGVCAVLIIAIAILFITGRRDKNPRTTDPTVPQAGEVVTATPEPEQELEPYPDDATKQAIMASDIEVQPADLDYVKAPETATVTVGVGNKTLRLRTGPNTSYHQLAEMPNGSTVDVFAKKDDWVLVRYESDDGTLYGWCSKTYLITTSGTVG